jgi:hypothetical protein
VIGAIYAKNEFYAKNGFTVNYVPANISVLPDTW